MRPESQRTFQSTHQPQLPRINRRKAVLGMAASLGAARWVTGQEAQAALPRPLGLSSAPPLDAKTSPICVFTKPFNSLSFNEMAERIAELGFEGIEAPIRKGGHVEPAEVPDKLPALVEALKKCGLEISIMTSDINDASDPLSVQTLKVAASLGIKRYRMKYFKYDLKRPVSEQLEAWRPKFRELADLNRELGIRALYQNHAGKNTLGAPLWDLKSVLKGIKPTEIGVAYDIRHAVVEGGKSWPITFDMIRAHIDSIYVKDFVWESGKLKNVPLGDGQVPQEFFRLLAKTDFSGPISLHEEYLDHRRPELVPDHLAAIRKDITTLKMLLQR
ncbi:MAG: sugar phosphate isomerase/epimerase [Mariniblastus sp.]|jgi:sugar phosphate isomerase/epimerase